MKLAKKLVALTVVSLMAISGSIAISAYSYNDVSEENIQQIAPLSGFRLYTVNGSNVAIRRQPGLNTEVIGRLQVGEWATVTNPATRVVDGLVWVEVTMTSGGNNGRTGWVAYRYLTFQQEGMRSYDQY